MRVLFVDQFSELGGAQLGLRDVLAETKRRGWHVELMAPGGGPLFDFCREQAIPAHRLRLGEYSNARKALREIPRYGLDMWLAARAVRSLIIESGIDLVVANGPRILPSVAFAGRPVVLHLHSLLQKNYARRIARWSLQRNRSQVICVSRFIAESVPYSAVRVVYNGVADQGYSELRTRTGPARVGIIGRIAPEKGHLDFVRAARAVSASRRNVRFTVHGAGLFSDPSFEELVRREAAGSQVEFHGWTDDIRGVLHDTDILAVPSTGVEATPRVIMESLSAGTPIVAYASGGIPEMIRDGFTGVLTERPHYTALASSIETLLANPSKMAQFAQNGRSEWHARFRLERFQTEVCDLLERHAEDSGQTESAAAVAGKHSLI